MATPTCELCGGTEFVKSEGMFVCQECGTKYSPEDAQKLMQEDAPKGVVAAMAEGTRHIGEPHESHHEPAHDPHHEPPRRDWQEQELRSGADFNAQAVNINAAGPRGVNNYVCQAWQLMIEEYNAIEHPDKQQLDALVSRAKECLMLLNSAAMIDPADNVQCLVVYGNCAEIEESVKEAKYWEQAEDGSWKSKQLGAFDKVEIAGQSESWSAKRDAYHTALEQIYFSAHQEEVAQKQQLKEEADGIQAQLDELKDEKRSKGFFNFKEKGEVKERMKPVKEQLAQINREIYAIDSAARKYADGQLSAAANAYVILDF